MKQRLQLGVIRAMAGIVGVAGNGLLGASLAFAVQMEEAPPPSGGGQRTPGLESPFPGEVPAPAPTTPAPGEPAVPSQPERPTTEVPPGDQPPVPAPAPGEGAPTFESEAEPYVPQLTPAEEQIQLGVELLEQGQDDLALQHFEEATKLAAEKLEMAVAYFHLGTAYRMLNRFDEAIDAYTEAIANDPNDGEAFLRRGIVWFYKGEYGIAWDDFDDASAILIEEPTPELWKGLAYARRGQWLDAIHTYGVAVQHDPTFGPAYANRGLAYLQVNEPGKAVADFNQAIRLDPKNAANYFRRGVAQTRMGRFDDATHSYTQAIRLNPEYAEAYFNRNLLHGQRGDAQGASRTGSRR